MQPKGRLIVALDVPSLRAARPLHESLAPYVGLFKIGKQLFTAAGPAAIHEVRASGGEVFLDLKFHDIPNTVEGAARSATTHGVKMFDVHCAGGIDMMKAAVHGASEAAAKTGRARPMILGVTVLTSMNYGALLQDGAVKSFRDAHVGVQFNFNPFGPEGRGMMEIFRREQVEQLVLRRADQALEAGLDGVIASPQESVPLRKRFGAQPKIVTPGIRFADSNANDQVRIGTPEAAIAAGADYVVVGRPITAAANPIEAAERAVYEIKRGLAARAA